MFSRRTRISIAQLLRYLPYEIVSDIADKYNIDVFGDVFSKIKNADFECLMLVVQETVNKKNSLRTEVQPRYKFDEQWADLEKCLMLDGYRFENGDVVRFDPDLGESAFCEDDLYKEIENSGLSANREIIHLLEQSADDFRKADADLNGALTNARVALETLVRGIAKQNGWIEPEDKNSLFGPALGFLRINSFLTKQEDETIHSVYKFVCPGAHVPVLYKSVEFVRLGRSLVGYMIYFLLRTYRNWQ
ncbi:hypothetical protein LLH00_07655 [bacterium]|nr:hypothetical protein [bacterium]